MRFTGQLNAQHLGWLFKKHWQIQGKRVPRNTGALAEVENLNIEIKDPQSIVKEKENYERFEVIGSKTNLIAESEGDPIWHKEPCHIYGNRTILLEGLPQAQVLTNTLEIKSFPKNIATAIGKIQICNSVDERVQNSIAAAHVLDAEQVKLPKVKSLERPYQNLPRLFGITYERRKRLLINKLLAECERSNEGRVLAFNRKIVDDANFRVTLQRDADLVQFCVSVQKMLISRHPLEVVKDSFNGSLPDLYPIKCTITIPKKHYYSTKVQFPLGSKTSCSHPHTIFLDFNKANIRNLHGPSASRSQFESRNMLIAFAVASAHAKQLNMDDSKLILERPVVIQSVQTDGRIFHFGVFQLNTLSLSNTEGIKNYWFHQPSMELFSECNFKEGKPVVNGYNKFVFRCLSAFYNNT